MREMIQSAAHRPVPETLLDDSVGFRIALDVSEEVDASSKEPVSPQKVRKRCEPLALRPLGVLSPCETASERRLSRNCYICALHPWRSPAKARPSSL